MRDSNLHPETEKLQGLVEGNLDEGARVLVESHLVECTSCAAEVAEWRALFTVLADLPQFTPSVHFADNVMRSIELPDPWYIRVLAQAGDRLQVFVPQTTRGWAMASAFLALPIVVFGALTYWIMSQPYLTPGSVFAFVVDRGNALINAVAQGALARVMQTDLALFAARGLETLSAAGLGTAGALLAGVFVATAASAYILYQNLFRANAQRNRRYVTYSF